MTSNDLLLFRASGPGAKLHIPFQVAEDGDYELIAQVAHSLDYGSYAVLLEGPRRHRPCRGSRDSGARTTAQVSQSALAGGCGDPENQNLALGSLVGTSEEVRTTGSSGGAGNCLLTARADVWYLE